LEINRTFEYIFKISAKTKQKFLNCNFLGATSSTAMESNAAQTRHPTPRNSAMDTSTTELRSATRNESILKSKKLQSNISDFNDEVFTSHSDKCASPRAPPPPSQTAGQLPAQYNRVRAARKIATRATVLGGFGSFPRTPAAVYPESVGHIDVQGTPGTSRARMSTI
jgi:hypothetical protein